MHLWYFYILSILRCINTLRCKEKELFKGDIMKQLRTTLLLLLTALIWGVSFVAQDAGMEYIGPLTFNFVRFFIGGCVLLPLIFVLDKKGLSKKTTTKEDRSILLKGCLACGLALGLSMGLQQSGIPLTTIGKAGFISALYIVIVPLLGLFVGKKLGLNVIASVIISLIGLYVMCMTEGFSLTPGDTLITLSAIGFSFHILIIDYFSPKVDGVRMACGQFFIASLISSIGAFTLEIPKIDAILDCTGPLLYAGVLSCGVAFTLQIVAQKDTDPTVASLILSLESVFALLGGWLILGQVLTIRESLGCALVFIAIILAQLPSKNNK